MGVEVAIGAFFCTPRKVHIQGKWWQGQQTYQLIRFVQFELNNGFTHIDLLIGSCRLLFEAEVFLVLGHDD
jgi:hypothetical protein